MNRIEILVGSDWIMNSARSRLPRDALVAALILGSLALFAFPVYPFPPGYDSTTDPRVAGFPFTHYCLCSVQTSPDSWTSTYQLYWIALIEDFLFWISIVFLFDIMLPKGRSRGTFQPLRMLAHMSVRESQPRATRRVTGTAVGVGRYRTAQPSPTGPARTAVRRRLWSTRWKWAHWWFSPTR